MATVQGLDLSYCQPTVNFKTVKDQGYKFVILRAGYGNAVLYPNQYDPTFESHYQNAKAQGLDVGVYWYSYAQSVEAAKQEAQACINIMKGKKFEYPIYFDIEERSQFDKGVSFCDSIITAFCSEIEKAGYYAGLYCSTFWLTNYVSASVRSKYPVWIAEYNSKCNYKDAYGIWQNGTVYLPGTGYVDHDYCYVDYPSIIKKAGKNGYTVTPTPTPTPAPVTYKTYYANDKSGVNYRKTPNGVLMGTYKYAEAVSVVVGSETTKDGIVWVKAKNGYWSAKNLLSTTKPQVDTYKTYYANDPTGVNYRKTPNGVLMGTYAYGQAVDLLVGSDTVKDGLTWVKAKNGYWSAKNLFSTVKPNTDPYQAGKTYTLQRDMKVRSGAGSNYSQLKNFQLTATDKKNAYNQTYAVLKKGTKITPTKVVKNSSTEYWGKISSGYVCLMSGTTKYAK